MKPPNWLIIILATLFSLLIWFYIDTAYQKGQNYGLEGQLNQFYTINGLYLRANVLPYHLEISNIGDRVITAYNPVPEQTDSDPCISASGMNVCETNKNIVATNEFAFGTQLMIDGKIWEVQDRTHSRYKYRIDLLMYDYQDAINWGKKTLKIGLVN